MKTFIMKHTNVINYETRPMTAAVLSMVSCGLALQGWRQVTDLSAGGVQEI